MKAPVALVAIGAVVVLLWLQRLEVGYLFASRDPIALGAEGDYRLDRLESNRYAQVHGAPTTRGAYANLGDQVHVVVGLRETPLLVMRPALPGEEWKGGTPPRPNPSPFAVRGRLLSREDAGKFEDAFVKLGAHGEVSPAWILLEGVRPGRDLEAWLWLGGLVLFGVVNAWLLARDVSHRLALRRTRKVTDDSGAMT